MATLTIRKLDDGVYDRLKLRARSNGRSLEAEVRVALAEAAPATTDMVEDLRSFHDQMVAKHGYLPDSTDLIREMRRGE